MKGSSRENFAALRERMDARRGHPALDELSRELFAVADVLSGDMQLRTALADAGQPTAARINLSDRVFADHVSSDAVTVVGDAVGGRWPSPQALIEALEGLAAQAAFLAAEQSGDLTAVEDELYAFQRLVTGTAQLQMALTDPARGDQEKAALIGSLLEGRVTGQTSAVLAHAMSHLRGRRADSVIEDLIQLAAEQRNRSVAEVRVARALDEDQAQRLAAVLSRIEGRQVRLNVAIDPSVIGGISVRIGGRVMDATMATRMEQARRTLVS